MSKVQNCAAASSSMLQQQPLKKAKVAELSPEIEEKLDTLALVADRKQLYSEKLRKGYEKRHLITLDNINTVNSDL